MCAQPHSSYLNAMKVRPVITDNHVQANGGLRHRRYQEARKMRENRGASRCVDKTYHSSQSASTLFIHSFFLFSLFFLSLSCSVASFSVSRFFYWLSLSLSFLWYLILALYKFVFVFYFFFISLSFCHFRRSLFLFLFFCILLFVSLFNVPFF